MNEKPESRGLDLINVKKKKEKEGLIPDFRVLHLLNVGNTKIYQMNGKQQR